MQSQEIQINPKSNASSKTNWFQVVYNSVLGFLAAIAVAAVFLFLLSGVGYWCYEGYCRWFSTDNMEIVGTNGNYYDLAHSCFVKPMPNRRVLKGCNRLDYDDGDSIGVACVGANKYRYVNLNSLTFLDDHIYYRAELFHNGRAFALSRDTLYLLSYDGKTIQKESSSWIYRSVEEIQMTGFYDDDEGPLYREIPTGVYMYEDAYGNYGLMSSEFVKLTEPIFSNITPKSKDVYLCEYAYSEMGILVNRNGKILK